MLFIVLNMFTKTGPQINFDIAQSSRLFATPWTAAHQAPLSMKFSRQGYWSGSPFPSPGDLLNPGIEPGSPALQADALPTELQGKPLRGKLRLKEVTVLGGGRTSPWIQS